MLGQFSNLIYATSTRESGSIKINGKFNKENLLRFKSKLSVEDVPLVLMKQVHGKDIALVTDSRQEVIENVDGVVTNKKGIMFGVVTADCLPIAFYDPKKQIIGVVHAGYKGILKGILEEVVSSIEQLGGLTSNILVSIGPSIGICCYDVDKERVRSFSKAFPHSNDISLPAGKVGYYSSHTDRFFLNLKRIALLKFLELGLLENNMRVSPLCTKCNLEKYFSFRGDSKETYGEFMTMIGMR